MKRVTVNARRRVRLSTTKVRYIAELTVLSTILCTSGMRFGGMVTGVSVCIF